MPNLERRPARLPLVACAWVLLSAGTAAAQNAPVAIEGLFVTVPNPITSEAVTLIKNQVNVRVQGENNRAQKVVFDFNPGDKPAATADFGACYSLAEFIGEVKGKADTVAFVHAKVSGHTVLPVLACSQLVMGQKATLGEIVGDQIPALDGVKMSAYQVIATRDAAAAAEAGKFQLVRKMFDPGVELRSGISQKTTQKVYIDARDAAQRAAVAGPTPVPGVPDGQIGLYSAETARAVGLSKATLNTRAEVAEEFGLRPNTRDDVLQGRAPEVYRWVLDGDLDASKREAAGRALRELRRKGGNVLLLVISCGGRDLVTARGLADDLVKAQAGGTGEDPIMIIGFIPASAPDAGTVVALGCTDIVMTRPKGDDAREAEIGDFSGYLQGTRAGDAEANLGSIRELAKAQGYSEVLIEGMFKKDAEIVLASKKNNAGRRRLMTREEFEQANQQAAAAGKPEEGWNEAKVIKPRGQLLKLNATVAAEVGLARFTVEGADPRSVTLAYGYPESKELEGGWLDKFADFLRLPVVTVLLVVIGFTGLILELKVPGLTVPGIIAALCFILVFWSQSRFSGQMFVLALLLFLMGLVLVGLEIFVLPGFGVCGIFGVLCMLAGLGLVTLDKVPQTGAEWGGFGVKVSQYLFALMGALALAFLLARFLPKMPYANRLVLDAPAEQTGSSSALPGAGEAAELLGAIGTTNTPLRPAGVVKFGDKFVDVVSDGGFVPAGTRVQVIQVEGTRIVVKEV